MGAVTVDFDNYMERIDEAKKCLVDFLPCKVRISGGKRGLHILKICANETDYSHALHLRKKYDDPKRFFIDEIRAKKGLVGNVLSDIKCIGNIVKVADKWVDIENKNDIEVFLNVHKTV